MVSFGLPETTISLIKKILASYSNIEGAKIFGSRAKGNYKPSSDIDLVLYGNIDNRLLRHIAFELEELTTPYKFDVISYLDINNERLKQSIDTYGKDFFIK